MLLIGHWAWVLHEFGEQTKREPILSHTVRCFWHIEVMHRLSLSQQYLSYSTICAIASHPLKLLIAMVSQFLLPKVTTEQLQDLIELLWSWSIHAKCRLRKPCEPPVCQWHRFQILKAFFQLYEGETSSFRSDVKQGQMLQVTSSTQSFGRTKDHTGRLD